MPRFRNLPLTLRHDGLSPMMAPAIDPSCIAAEVNGIDYLPLRSDASHYLKS